VILLRLGPHWTETYSVITLRLNTVNLKNIPLHLMFSGGKITVCFITFHPDFPSCAFIISLANLPGVFIGPTSLSPHPFFSWKRLDFPQPPAILPAIYPSNILELPLTALSFNFMTALTH